MNKTDLLLAALAAGSGVEHTPVQIQKLLFLIDRNLRSEIGSSFNFVPYDYGPFDSDVYDELRSLELKGCAVSETTPRGWKKYKLTDAGQSRGDAVLAALSPRVRNYVNDVSQFVLSLSFADLVSAVYKAYPEMKINSVFRG